MTKKTPAFRGAFALSALLAVVATAGGCQASVEDVDASEGQLGAEQELDATTERLALFRATTADLQDTDLPLQAARVVWHAVGQAVEGETPAANAANALRAVDSAARFLDMVERLRAGEVDDGAFDAFVRALIADGTRIVPLDRLLKSWPPDTRFASLVRSAGGGGGDLSVGRVLELVRFFARNIEGSTLERRVQVLQHLLALKADAEQRLPALSSGGALTDAQTEVLFEAAELLAGADGYVNRGDAPRLLPVVPKIVAQIADRLIAQGMAEGVGELRARHPFVYRRWMRRPNGLIGRRVNAEIAARLSAAQRQKLEAMQKAAAASQQAWERGMTHLAVHRHGLESDGATATWDSGRELTPADVDRIVRAVTGASLATQLTASNAASIKNAAIERRVGALAEVKALMSRVELPDGIPVRDALTILRARRAGEELPLPWNLSFRMTQAGNATKLMIRAYRAPCECRHDAASARCVIDYADARSETRTSSGRAPAGGAGRCDLQRDCYAEFTEVYAPDRSPRATYLPYACAYRFRHGDGDTTSFYKHPIDYAVLDEDPDERFDGE